MELKADLHLHTREGDGFIVYDARSLIDRAAREGFQVLSITNHDVVTFNEDLEAYARERGILRGHLAPTQINPRRQVEAKAR